MTINDALLYTYRHYRRTMTGRYVPAVDALKEARKLIATGSRKYGKREVGTWNPPFQRDGRGAFYRWIENAGGLMREVGFADEIAKRADRWRSIDHKGWFTTDDGHSGDVYRGIVYRLPARDGRSVFAYGYADPNNDGAALIAAEFYVASDGESDEEASFQAAKLADGVAEIFAEDERDYQRAADAVRTTSEKAGEMRKAAREYLQELRDLREVGFVNPHDYETACESFEHAWSDYREAMSEFDDAARQAKRDGLCPSEHIEW